jgi:murein DD-endopeptidase MepM/ murein hydrolase activator NlpD
MKKTKLNVPKRISLKFGLQIKLILFTMVLAATSIVCSSGYITPASLTQTAQFTPAETIVPTVQFIRPTETLTPEPTATATIDPSLFTPTPIFDTPTPSPTPLPTSTQIAADTPPLQYFAQSGDTLTGLATRFNVHPFEIVSDREIPESGLITPGQLLMLPQRLLITTPRNIIIPDSEVVYSPTALDFITEIYVETVGGYLSDYTEYLSFNGISTGPDIIEITALNHSINPRLLLSLLEFNSKWVLGEPGSFSEESYPMGHVDVDETALSVQMSWAAKQISIGYYGWRSGTLTEIVFKDGSTLRIAPDLNAGTVGLMYYFAQIYTRDKWFAAIDPDLGFIALHKTMFNDPSDRAAIVEPLLSPGIQQPNLILPFRVGDTWAYTGGPHGAWSIEGAQAAIDFAPGSVAGGCSPSEVWAVASASGMVTRVEHGVLVLDLDGDGREQTGWALFYLHLLPHPTMKEGKWVNQGDLIGKPSCEGGRATGTHIHIARKYNGEWIQADETIPFILNGWTVVAGKAPYKGTLAKGTRTITASDKGAFTSRIVRETDSEDESNS